MRYVTRMSRRSQWVMSRLEFCICTELFYIYRTRSRKRVDTHGWGMSHVCIRHATHWTRHAIRLTHTRNTTEKLSIHTATKVSFATEPYKRDLYSAKETCTSKEPTNHSHPLPREAPPQGGEDPRDALSCMSFFAKEPLTIWLFCGKYPIR